jgi:DNA-binding NarL/FixJ family response regulator
MTGRIGPRQYRVLVVDDEPGHRLICRIAMGEDGSFECVGEAFHGRSAIERAAELQPDLVVLDLRMPAMDGLEALPHILEVAPRARVVVWSNEGELQRELARERGAHGAVSKLAPVRDLVAMLHRVASAGDGASEPAVAAT